MPRIMVVDDEINMLNLLSDLLEMEDFLVELAGTGESALEMTGRLAPDLMVLDLRLPGIQGMEVLKKLRDDGYLFPVVIITAHGDVDTSVEALKAGASDFIVKPFENERLLASIRQALEAHCVVAQAGMSRPALVGGGREMVGASKEMQNVFGLIDKVANTDATVLIEGESGTGKELVARAIHLKSARRDAPMICINCAALPETLLESELFGYERGAFTGAVANKAGKIELADGGTLFLDEVGDLSASAQAKLLRVLDEREFTPLGSSREIKVDIRVIAATNRDLEAMAEVGAFRQDLFFRLNVVPIYLPPLRERKDDVPALAEHFLEKCRTKHNKPDLDFDRKTIARLVEHSWPGNIRELEHAVEKYAILGDLPIPGPGRKTSAKFKPSSGPLREQLRNAEREIIIAALRESGGKKNQAAKALQITYKTLFNKIKNLEIGIEAKVK